jgi:hypothetical protein
MLKKLEALQKRKLHERNKEGILENERLAHFSEQGQCIRTETT